MLTAAVQPWPCVLWPHIHQLWAASTVHNGCNALFSLKDAVVSVAPPARLGDAAVSASLQPAAAAPLHWLQLQPAASEVAPARRL